MAAFAEQVIRNEIQSPAAIRLLARGVYLMNGGDPDNWDKMTPDEIQLIFLTHISTMKSHTNDILEGLVEILKAMG